MLINSPRARLSLETASGAAFWMAEICGVCADANPDNASRAIKGTKIRIRHAKQGALAVLPSSIFLEAPAVVMSVLKWVHVPRWLQRRPANSLIEQNANLVRTLMQYGRRYVSEL